MANKGLGRGLGSLLGTAEEEFVHAAGRGAAVKPPRADVLPSDGDGVVLIPVGALSPNPDQPRKAFDPAALEELAASIRRHGVIQPLVAVSRGGGRYMLVAGERRWRAAQLAGLKAVPAVVKQYDEQEIKEISLIENLQREDLNAVEAARAIQRLMQEYRYTQENVASRIGKSRPYIANLLRLLDLPPDILSFVAADRLSAGHARALAALKDPAAQTRLADAACDGKMSVRDLERAVKAAGAGKHPKPAPPKPFGLTIELKELKTLLQRVFATKVEILGNDQRGRIYIDYYSRDDIDRIAELIFKLR